MSFKLDLGARKRSQSEVILENFDAPTKLNVLQYFVKKEDFEDEKSKKENYLQMYLKKVAESEKTTQKLYHLELERSQVIRDSAMLYKRSILELQLQIFIGLHRTDDYGDGCGPRMLCDDGWEQPISFTSAMRHWRTCPLHSSSPHIRTDYEEGLVRIKNVPKKFVEKSIDNLYGTISQELHFSAGENYPIKIIQFPRNEDTLAMLSFLEHYAIPFFVVGEHPLPSTVVQNSEETCHSMAPSKAGNDSSVV